MQEHLANDELLTFCGHVKGLDQELQHLLRLVSLLQLIANGSVDPVQVNAGISVEADVPSLHIVLDPVLLVVHGQVEVGLKVLSCLKVDPCKSANDG